MGMSWQEELQQLDTELAQGRVTAEDYRQRRDQLIGLAQQSGAQQADPAQQQQRPDQGNGPFGAPFRWQPGSQDSVESTQVMKPIGDDPSSQNSPERTQVVSPSAGQGENPDRTQVVPGSTPSPQQNFPPLNYQGFGQQQQASWVQPPAASSAAPWNSDEDP
ncbi:MAG: hypothetical protein JOZ47_22785, partial [Kutzneria sp.]|nr:hypothetical protein [Kutzneria sp.]